MNERIIWKRKTISVPQPIPDDCVICPNCKGTGRYRFRWSEPSGLNDPSVSDYRRCSRCMGEGYITKEELKHLEDLERMKRHIKDEKVGE